MVINCEACSAKFRIDTTGITLPKFKIKCPQCKNAIVVENPPEVDVPVTMEPASEPPPAASGAPSNGQGEDAAPIVPPPEPSSGPEPASEPASEPATASADAAAAAHPPSAFVPPPPPTEQIGEPAETTATQPVEMRPPPPSLAAASDSAVVPPPPPTDSVPPPPPGEPDERASRVRKKSGGSETVEEIVETVREELKTRYHHLKDCNYFELLEVEPDEPVEKVKSAYFRLAKKYHPDRFTTHFEEAEMQQVREIASRLNLAFGELRDPERHEQYKLKILEPERFERQQTANRVMEAMMQYEKGKVLFNKQGWAEALECFEWAVELHPDEAEYHYMLGQTALRATDSGRTLESIEESLKRAAELDEKSVKYMIGLGRYWQQRGEVKRAMMCFKRARDLDPNNHEVKREIKLYLARKRKDEAENSAAGKIKRLFTGSPKKGGSGRRG